MLEIGKRMKELRESCHLSQAEIAKLCGSNQSTIARMESGQTAPTVKVLLWWADYFNVSMDYLSCRTDRPQGIPDNGIPKIRVDEEKVKQFIDMCFDPNSSVSGKVKDSLFEIFKEESK